MNHRRLSVLLSTAFLLAACARESARANVPADLTGTYTFVGVDTTRGVPWAARIELALAQDSTFQFEMRLRVKEDDEQETESGSYRVEGDRLVLVGADQKEQFALAIRGDSLVLDAGWVAMAALRLIGVPRPVLIKES